MLPSEAVPVPPFLSECFPFSCGANDRVDVGRLFQPINGLWCFYTLKKNWTNPFGKFYPDLRITYTHAYFFDWLYTNRPVTCSGIPIAFLQIDRMETASSF